MVHEDLVDWDKGRPLAFRQVYRTVGFAVGSQTDLNLDRELQVTKVKAVWIRNTWNEEEDCRLRNVRMIRNGFDRSRLMDVGRTVMGRVGFHWRMIYWVMARCFGTCLSHC